MATQPTEPKPRRMPPGLASPGDAGSPRAASNEYTARAILLWPGLDRRRLSVARGDPERIARLVARRTNLPPDTILRMLGVRSSAPPDIGSTPPDP